MRDHVIVCGYGVKGRAAIEQIRGQGVAAGGIVVIDESPAAIASANADGYAGVLGDATHSATLQEAGIGDARAVVVAPTRDDTAVPACTAHSRRATLSCRSCSAQTQGRWIWPPRIRARRGISERLGPV